MNKLLILGLLCFSIAACRDTANTVASQHNETKQDTPAPVVANDGAEPAAKQASMDQTADDTLFTFPFTAEDETKTEADPRFVKWEDSPCGPSPIMKVSSMPLKDNAILPDYIIEFNAEGKEIKRWGKPYNADFISLHQDIVLFTQLNDAGDLIEYSTDSQGNIQRGNINNKTTPNISDAKPVKCPAFEVFGESAYLQCYELIDEINKSTRRIAFEGACT